MKYQFLLTVLVTALAINVNIEISKSELRTLLIPVLQKMINQSFKLNFDYSINVGIGKLKANKLELRNFSLDEDSINIQLLSDSNYVKINGIIEYFIADIDIEVTSLVGTLLTNTVTFEVVGVEIESSFRITNNIIELQNQKFDKFSIKQFKLKSGESAIETVIKTVINQILDKFQHFIEEQGVKKIVKFLSWRDLTHPTFKYQISKFTITDSEQVAVQLQMESQDIMNQVFPSI